MIDTGQRGGVSLGAETFASFAESKYNGWWTNKRMPAPASGIQSAILHRAGRSTMPNMTRTAVCAHWNTISVDDIFSLSASGGRALTFHALVSDVIIIQPSAYEHIAFRTAV